MNNPACPPVQWAEKTKMAEQIKLGNLVKTMQARIGCPLGEIGLVISEHPNTEHGYVVYEVLLLSSNRSRHFLGCDLEKFI
jgi:hypothetical protein